jgi:benzoate/toluate 1,2-dioxygenase subunit alpha
VIQIHQDNSANLAKLESMLLDDPKQHLYRLDRSAFTDEQLFELELKYIFEGNWVYLAHESQIPNVNDYLTVFIGRQPVVITRSKDGKLNALANTCTHRGAVLCRSRRATSRASPARSTAGRSATPASC